MMETSARIEAQGETLEQGYKACRKQVKKDLKPLELVDLKCWRRQQKRRLRIASSIFANQ